jgi:hypothetical protein
MSELSIRWRNTPELRSEDILIYMCVGSRPYELEASTNLASPLSWYVVNTVLRLRSALRKKLRKYPIKIPRWEYPVYSLNRY